MEEYIRGLGWLALGCRNYSVIVLHAVGSSG